jgi:hypothetical protein
MQMRLIAMVLLAAVIAFDANAQLPNAQLPSPAVKGATYGSVTNAEGAITVNELATKMNGTPFTGKVTGKVSEVCQEKGCWMKLEKENGETLMVKFKDYSFFIPRDIAGRDVVLDGEAIVKEVSVKQQKHYAEDAGKSKGEIDKIKAPRKEVQFIAKSVLVL